MERVKIWRPGFSDDIHLSASDFNQFEFKPHVHQDFHLGMIERGSQRFFHKGKKQLLGPGALSLLNPDELHDGTGPESGYRVRVFNLPQSWIERELEASHYFHTALCHDPHLYRALFSLHQEMELTPDAEGFDARLLVLTSLLFQRYGEGKVPLQTHKLSASQCAHIKDFLRAHLDSKLSLEAMSAQTGLSKFAFLRQFKQAFGLTPHAYLTQLRVEQGRALLCAGMSVAEVAQQVGFYDQSHFVKAFKRAFGSAPGCVSL